MKDPAAARIVSTRANEPELEEAIDRFVVDLAERIDLLQEAQIAGDFETLAKLATELQRDADDLGFPSLASVASELERSTREREEQMLLERLLDLTELGRRVRSGHPGAC
jgi:HPt (histidine-containing phosphotransfer) domain-containing protein